MSGVMWVLSQLLLRPPPEPRAERWPERCLAVSVSDGVWMYQITDPGLALELTAKNTKYYKDDDLN